MNFKISGVATKTELLNKAIKLVPLIVEITIASWSCPDNPNNWKALLFANVYSCVD